ncbi:1703_t:CDS:2 [Acaulospora morrowiae]|uniref:1703_t:CDS:1 n=1 Tax=Acaulospora morrowiae TaxID=94023 RepID=A0A9N9FPU9_9GLOM|nr:1703_t:CDS:2 [Acaulospora morrowiae]
MPPIREHAEEETSKLLDDRKRGGKRAPSINTRASRVGVTNFINVIKSLHPGQSISYFPITRETLEEYIDAKRKAHIKSGSLEQYLQHIQAYNLALGYGWDGSVFGPLIKKSLDELRLIEEEALALTQSLQTEVSLDSSNENTNRISNLMAIDEHANIDENENIDENNSKIISLLCFDATTILEQRANINLDNLKYADPLLNLQQLYDNISSATVPLSWGSADILRLYYRIGTRDDSQHCELNDESAFVRFWTSFNKREDVQLIVYRKSNNDSSKVGEFTRLSKHRRPGTLSRSSNLFDLTSRRSEPLPPSKTLDTLPTLKSITVRSKSRVYKERIAVSDTTTFSSLVSFAIRITLPPGKQLVIRDTVSDLEYMPDDLVREVIKGVEHADVTAAIEDINTIDFNYF